MCVAFAGGWGLNPVMSGVAAVVLLFLQDPLQDQIDDAVRQFEAAEEADQALTLLSSQLIALGAQATNPLARRLARNLREGMASAAAPAFIEALVGRPDALPPLQSAFRDATTRAAGRIELAEALLQLEDAMSWRAGLLEIAADATASLTNRLRACKVLLEAEDPRTPAILRSLVDGLARRSEADQCQAVDFLKSLETPLSRDLLVTIASDERIFATARRAAEGSAVSRPGAEEPSVRIHDGRPRSGPDPASAHTAVKKEETDKTSFLTMPTILAGGTTLVLIALLLLEILRKG